MVRTTSSVGQTTLMKAVSFVRLFRLQSGEMPMQQADVLLAIAAKPGISMAELTQATGLAQSSVSRNVAGLSSYVKAGSPGLGFVEAVIDPQDPRRRLLFLTQQGKVFVQKLGQIIDEGFRLDEDTASRARLHPQPEGEMSPRKKPANVKLPIR